MSKSLNLAWMSESEKTWPSEFSFVAVYPEISGDKI